MTNIRYKILWIDDQHEELLPFKGQAKRNGIDFIPFKSFQSGIEELEQNYAIYDGILLDAKFFMNDTDLKGTEDTDAIFEAKDRILQLPKKFEILVLTGQAEAYDGKHFKQAFKKVYRKGVEQQINQLFDDLKQAADQQQDTQIRHQYSKVFEVCTDEYIGSHVSKELLELLKIQENEPDLNYFNNIRNIMEDFFEAFVNHELMPEEILKGKKLYDCNKFLIGKKYDGKYFDVKGIRHDDETHLSSFITSQIQHILDVTQDASHRLKVDAHIKAMNTPYLFKSILYQVMDLLVWFKYYIDTNPIKDNWYSIDY